MLNSKKDVLAFLTENKSLLTQQYGVETLAIFGSFARDSVTNSSDLDLLVNIKKEYKKYLVYYNLKKFLSSKVGREIDLVLESNMNPIILKSAQKDLIYVK